MPNPARIHHQSSKLEHFLGLADLYIRFGKPEVFDIEPQISPDYRPDAYMVMQDKHIIIEYQRTPISNKRMQIKCDAFFSTYAQGRHSSRELWIVSGNNYQIVTPSNFIVRHIEKAPGA